jgi:hypothetical protein
MTFAKNLSRGIAFGALAVGLTLSNAAAQNGTNYHVLSSDTDALYIGVGAGGSATGADGLGTWIPGEDQRGSNLIALFGGGSDFAYRQPRWRENVCVFDFAPGEGFIGFGGIIFIEFAGMNPNRPAVFSKPFCTPGAASAFFSTAGIPYGGGNPGFVTTVGDFLLSGLPSAGGLPSSSVILLPNEGLVGAGATGGATLIAAAAANLGIASTGFCWGVQFSWLPSALTITDDSDGLWHYNINSPAENQYWMMSTDEINLWQSYTVGLSGGGTVAQGFLAQTDYQMLLTSVSPNTTVSLAPQGLAQSGFYYMQTENIGFNPNGGFDVGRGSQAVSMSGLKGAINATSLVGNQDPAGPVGIGAGPFLPTLGLVTWDNGGDLDGSSRLGWLSLDFLGSFLAFPSSAYTDLTLFGGTVRAPIADAGDFGVGGLPSGLFGVFVHTTSLAPSGWPDAGGFSSGAFGVPPIAGGSIQLPMPVLPAVCIGIPVIVTYGSSGLTDGGGLTWNQDIAATSGSKELVLFD